MKAAALLIFIVFSVSVSAKKQGNKHYITNQSPLVAQPYTALPIGSIQPEGFLLKMLEIQRDG